MRVTKKQYFFLMDKNSVAQEHSRWFVRLTEHSHYQVGEAKSLILGWKIFIAFLFRLQLNQLRSFLHRELVSPGKLSQVSEGP